MEKSSREDPSARLQEAALPMLVTSFPSGVRDFLLVHPSERSAFEALHPLRLLELDRTARLIERLAYRDSSLALVIALCRLLVPCLRYRGSGRHLVVEPWALADLRGETLSADVPTSFARELSTEQAAEFQAIRTGQQPPEGSLAELFWTAQTDLPALQLIFDDPELGQLAKALYFFLVPDGHCLAEIDPQASAAQVEQLRAEGFASLQLDLPSRRLRPAFRKLLAVTVRYASQLTGTIAEELIGQRLRQACRPELNEAEKELLVVCHYRIGASAGVPRLCQPCGTVGTRLTQPWHTEAETRRNDSGGQLG